HSAPLTSYLFFYFFEHPVSSVISSLSLHDALPICCHDVRRRHRRGSVLLRPVRATRVLHHSPTTHRRRQLRGSLAPGHGASTLSLGHVPMGRVCACGRRHRVLLVPPRPRHFDLLDLQATIWLQRHRWSFGQIDCHPRANCHALWYCSYLGCLRCPDWRGRGNRLRRRTCDQHHAGHHHRGSLHCLSHFRSLRCRARYSLPVVYQHFAHAGVHFLRLRGGTNRVATLLGSFRHLDLHRRALDDDGQVTVMGR